MIPYWRLSISPLAMGAAIAAITLARAPIASPAAAALPKDPCALLKPAEIQSALAPSATIASGKPDSGGLPLGIGCNYKWGPRSDKWGETSLTVMIIDATKAWPNTSAETLEEGLTMKVRAAGPDAKASMIPGVGDAAAFTYEARSYNAMVEAYFKGKAEHVSITFHEGNSLQDKDKLIALLKQAAARL